MNQRGLVMTRKTKRRVAFLLAAELSMILIGGAGLAWIGADIVVRALRLALIG